MAFIDDSNTLMIKLVYYGPALSGKTTNLVQLHDLIRPQQKGEIMVLETEGDRTLFFDAFPVGMRAPSGLRIKIKLYTVPGQVQHDSTRKALLSRVDGVLFVADLQRQQQFNDSESFNNLIRNLGTLGMDVEATPILVQFNKMDLEDIMDMDALRAKWEGTPWGGLHFASALRGQGVLESFCDLLGKVFVSLDERFSLQKKHGLTMQSFIDEVTGTEQWEAL